MPNNENLGASFSIDITNLKAGLNQANRLIRESESEFKAAAATMDDWTESQAGLEARIKHLNNAQDLQKKKVEALKKQYAEAGYASDDLSAEAVKLRTQINKEQEAFNKTEKELGEMEDALLEMGEASKKSHKWLSNLGDVADDAGDGFTVAKGALASFIGDGLTKLTDAASNAISSIANLADETRKYRQTLATLDSAAQDVGVSTDYIRDKFTDMMGVFNDEGSVTEGLNNLLTAGFDEKSLDSITSNLEGAALKWKDTLKFEGLADSLQEWIGSGGANLSGNFAELLERMGYNLEEVQEKTKGMTDEQRRTYAVNLLASEGMAEVSEKYREQNSDMIAAQQANVDYQNGLAEMGAKIEPVMTTVKQGLTDVLAAIMKLLEDVDLEALQQKITEAFDKFINEILPKIVEFIQWFIDNKDIVIAGITGIAAAMMTMNVANMIMGLVKSFQAFKKAQEGATIAQWLLNAAMSANPIGLVVAAIVGLVAAFAVLWNKSEGFRNFFIGMWEGIKKVVSGAIDFIGKYIETGVKVWKGIINTVISLINFAIRAINKISVDIPEWVPEFGGKTIGFNLKEIPKLARGGVVRGATQAIIGEDGAEAVVPLERNRQWIKAVADEMALQQKQSVVINQTNNYSQAHSRYEIYKSKKQTEAAVRLAMGAV